MKIDIGSKKGLLVIPVQGEKDKITFFDAKKNKDLKEKIKHEVKSYPSFSGKKEEAVFMKIADQKVLLIGINKGYSLEDLRKSYSIVFKTLKARKETSATIEVPEEDADEIKAIVEGLDLSDYKFDKYIMKKEEKDVSVEVSLDIDKKFASVIKDTQLVNGYVKQVRNLVNENASVKIPSYLAHIVTEFGKKHHLKTKVLDEKDLKREGLGLLYAVGEGAACPPRLVIAEYNGNPKSKEKIALVGKGIVFDSGGMNLKPTGYMEDMKTDMAGAATCMGAFMSAVELGLKKNIILVMACAENAISNTAFKPGDFFIAYNGLGVEIGNTDAEGRLVLADAVAYVGKNYKPTHIVDLATLTGACMVALGLNTMGLFGNDKKLKDDLIEVGEEAGERLWELPLFDEHRDAMKSKFADIRNDGTVRYGGASQGAAFIEKFIEENIKWAHLDIAGPSRSKKDEYYVPEYATGRGMRLLVEFLRK